RSTKRGGSPAPSSSISSRFQGPRRSRRTRAVSKASFPAQQAQPPTVSMASGAEPRSAAAPVPRPGSPRAPGSRARKPPPSARFSSSPHRSPAGFAASHWRSSAVLPAPGRPVTRVAGTVSGSDGTLSTGSAPPEGAGQHDEEGEQLEPAREHGQGQHPGLETAQRGVVAGGAELAERGAQVVDHGDRRRERGHEVQTGGKQQEGHHDLGRAPQQHEA